MEKIIIVGGGGHATVLISVIQRTNDFEILGYVDTIDRGMLLDTIYLGNDDILVDLSKITKYVVLGIGQVNFDHKRIEISKYLAKIGFEFPNIISPTAIINKGVKLGAGVQILDRAIVNCFAEIGNHTIINTNAVIEHDCSIGDYNHICPSATLNGSVKTGKNCIIGSSSVLIHNTKIACDCIIGAAGLVVKSISESGVYVGNPVKKIK